MECGIEMRRKLRKEEEEGEENRNKNSVRVNVPRWKRREWPSLPIAQSEERIGTLGRKSILPPV